MILVLILRFFLRVMVYVVISFLFLIVLDDDVSVLFWLFFSDGIFVVVYVFCGWIFVDIFSCIVLIFLFLSCFLMYCVVLFKMIFML